MRRRKKHYPVYVSPEPAEPSYPPDPVCPKVRLAFIRRYDGAWILRTEWEGHRHEYVRETAWEMRELADDVIKGATCAFCGALLVRVNGRIACPCNLSHYPQPAELVERCQDHRRRGGWGQIYGEPPELNPPEIVINKNPAGKLPKSDGEKKLAAKWAKFWRENAKRWDGSAVESSKHRPAELVEQSRKWAAFEKAAKSCLEVVKSTAEDGRPHIFAKWNGFDGAIQTVNGYAKKAPTHRKRKAEQPATYYADHFQPKAAPVYIHPQKPWGDKAIQAVAPPVSPPQSSSIGFSERALWTADQWRRHLQGAGV